MSSGDRTGWQLYVLWALQAGLALVFLAAGGAKLYGAPMMIETFDRIGLGQWFRYLTGFLEVAGALAVVIPATAVLGALLFCAMMVGAVVTHLVIGGSAVPALVLLLLSGAIAYLRRDQLAALLRSVRRSAA